MKNNEKRKLLAEIRELCHKLGGENYFKIYFTMIEELGADLHRGHFNGKEPIHYNYLLILGLNFLFVKQPQNLEFSNDKKSINDGKLVSYFTEIIKKTQILVESLNTNDINMLTLLSSDANKLIESIKKIILNNNMYVVNFYNSNFLENICKSILPLLDNSTTLYTELVNLLANTTQLEIYSERELMTLLKESNFDSIKPFVGNYRYSKNFFNIPEKIMYYDEARMKPICKLCNGKYMLLPNKISFYYLYLSLIKIGYKVEGFEKKIGIIVEDEVIKILKKKKFNVLYGNLDQRSRKLGQDPLESDLILDSNDSIFLFEIKKKTLTTESLNYKKEFIINDIVSTYGKSQIQLDKRTKFLETQNKITIDCSGNKVILDTTNKRIQKISLMFDDFNSLGLDFIIILIFNNIDKLKKFCNIDPKVLNKLANIKFKYPTGVIQFLDIFTFLDIVDNSDSIELLMENMYNLKSNYFFGKNTYSSWIELKNKKKIRTNINLKELSSI
ncbi:hypothetical protein [Fusobacterium sp. PH5-44]|uniref:hypothetical protein n=1 Tax=unclassified Fusobacterium TaxID=2648384 RepID=UPI003D23ABED